MTLRSTDYALLSQATYSDPVVKSSSASGPTYQNIVLDGIAYKPIAYADNPNNGFQATAYEVQNGTHEVVIAYRGTEFNREPRQDGITDARMAIEGVNNQTPDAVAFTKHVLDKANQDAKNGNYSPNITVTGHSLGGTHAEMMAYRFGLHGETFNAFGAAGLTQGIPQGGNQIIDNVRATDVVSAASPHFGQVRVFALPQDTQALSRAGYTDSRVANALLPHAPILGKIQGDAHAIDNFVPDSKLLGHSILTPQNEKYAQAHREMIQPYRDDIQSARSVAFVEYQIQKPAIEATVVGAEAAIRGARVVGHEAVQAYDATVDATSRGIEAGVNTAKAAEHMATRAYDATVDMASRGIETGVNTAKAAEHLGVRAYDATVDAASHGIDAGVNSVKAVEHLGARAYDAAVDITSRGIEAGAHAFKAAPLQLDNPAHPDHAFYVQAQKAVYRLDASMGRASDPQSDHLAAALVVAAKREGMNRIDTVSLSADGARAFAVQDHARLPLREVAHVQTLDAIHTSIAQSSAALAAIPPAPVAPIMPPTPAQMHTPGFSR